MLNNLGYLAQVQDDDTAARAFYEEGLAIQKDLGGRHGIAAMMLRNLGTLQEDHTKTRALFEESLSIWRELGLKYQVAYSLCLLGELFNEQGDYTAARAFFEEGLAIQKEMGDRGNITVSMEGFAVLAAAQGHPERALRLAGAAAALHEAIHNPLPPTHQARLDRNLEPARQALSEEAQRAAFEEGRAMTMEQAVEYALKDGS
jgi:non-specific serine/threonine protein kinase